MRTCGCSVPAAELNMRMNPMTNMLLWLCAGHTINHDDGESFYVFDPELSNNGRNPG